MIVGIGIDSVEIHRFQQWNRYTNAQLLRIFSYEEIEYCRSSLLKSSERFAVRFAAREALFKAINQTHAKNPIPFLSLCRATTISKDDCGSPRLAIKWEMLDSPWFVNTTAWISLTHTTTSATALVILERNTV